MSFDNILKSINDEADRNALSGVASKYPTIRELTELGEQARGAMPHLDRVRKATGKDSAGLEDALKLGADWAEWLPKAWDAERRMTKSEAAARDELTTAQTELEALRARGETEMTAEEMQTLIDRRIDDRGLVSKDKWAEALPPEFRDKDGKPLMVTRDQMEQRLNGMAGRFESIFQELTPQVVEHHQRFGESLDIGKVFKTMNEEFEKSGKTKLMTAKEAYDFTYRDKFEAAAKERRDKEIVEAEARGETKGRKEAMKETAGRGMPAGGGSGAPMGAVMKRVTERQKKTADGETIKAPLGRGIIASQAAQEYAEKGGGAGSL